MNESITTNEKIIISLTTYGDRIKTVDQVIASLKAQTYQCDKIILWIDDEEIEHSNLPAPLIMLEDDLFEIRFCPNYKSYKKLIPTLGLYPNAHVITFDDDILIPETVVEYMVKANRAKPDSVISTRARVMPVDINGQFEPYSHWTLLNNEVEIYSKMGLLPIGYGGVFYPAGSLSKHVTDVASFTKLADNADDIWFKCMSLLSGFGTVVLPRDVSAKYQIIENTQDSALYKTVNTDNRNVDCLMAVADNYPDLKLQFQSQYFSKVETDAIYMSKLLNRPQIFSDSNKGADFFRQAALSIEKTDLNLALEFMTIAKTYRPNGPLIKRKLKEYRQLLLKK
ncbi:hypothetical protein MK852_17130 [Shewanella benthica]|uniref:hypothetical protein n=1 Tax=Shewanella benthica TaxID=43661 RepID=UPI00187A6BBD|nr:hypothetical protein [Shewanella benthica]MBE7213949.1 hypothetical protein [Shewanella benthica]MCL1063838.1 hypothetical protein [Shewanella benthica]